MIKVQKDKNFMFLYETDTNKILKSEKLNHSGSTIMAETKLRVWAKRNGIKVK